jgi:ribosomal protein S27AE
MTTELRCPECGSTDVIPRATVSGHTWTSVVIWQKPNARFFKGNVHSEFLEAQVCGKCGFTKLFAKNPDKLLLAYRQWQET